MNVHNFKLVMKAIGEAPEWQNVMAHWHREVPNCGTAHCIAGWCEVLTNGEDGISDEINVTFARARQFLGLPVGKADMLFCKDEWPKQFRDQYVVGPKAKAMIARLAHFIETEGQE